MKLISSSKSFYSLIKEGGFCVSYLNLNNIYDAKFDLHYLVDSYFLAKYLAVDRLSPDFGSIMHDVLSKFDNVLFIGGDSAEMEVFLSKLSRHYIYKSINGVNGYENITTYIDLVDRLSPNLVVLSMGYPRQEKFAVQLRERFGSTLSILCSGAFVSQEAKSRNEYYPLFVNKFNFRWAYRLIKEDTARSRFPKIVRNMFKLIITGVVE